MTEKIASGPKKAGHARWGLAGVLGVLILLGAALWVFRAALAESALAQWCTSKDLSCTVRITRLDIAHVDVEDLRVASAQGEPFRTEAARADLRWRGLFSPQVVQVRLVRPVLRVRFDGERLSLLGLEALMGGGESGSSGSRPTVLIEEASLVLETPAGEARASLEAELDAAGEVALHASAEPALLNADGARLDLKAAVFSLNTVEGAPRAEMQLEIGGAALGAFLSGPASVSASLEPVADADDLQAAWSINVAAAEYAESGADRLEASGQARLAAPPGALSLSSLREALSALSAEVRAENVRDGALVAASAIVEASLSRRGEGEAVLGPVLGRFDGVQSPFGATDGLVIDGFATRGGDGVLKLTGEVDLSGAQAGSPLRGWLALVSTPPPVSNHGRALRDVMARALDRFDAELGFVFDLEPDETWRLQGEGPLQFESASGLKMALAGESGAGWMDIRPGRPVLAGALDMSGGGGPSLRVEGLRLVGRAGAFRLMADALDMASWRVRGLGLGAELETFSVERESGRILVAAQGEIGLNGALAGIDVSRVKVAGAVNAVRENGATTIRTEEETCLSWRAAGLTVAGVSVGRHATPLCPVNGVLIDGAAEALGGVFSVGALRLPVSRGVVAGQVDLADARLAWRAGGGFELRAEASAFDAPLEINGRAFEVDAGRFSAGAVFGRGPARYEVALDGAEFAGDLIPASLSADVIDLSLTARADGFEGALTVPRLTIFDRRDDPVYQPLETRIDGVVSKGRLQFESPLILQRVGVAVADMSLDLALRELSGTARIATGELRFVPNGLQPTQMSDRLRGVFTNATGVLEAEAMVDIAPTGLSGTGRVRADDFSFQTVALGRVSGVSGEVEFDQIFGLSTPPGQIVTIAAVDPGLPLSDGELRFQILDGRQARLERAAWPFAGGRIVVEPTSWTIGEARRAVTVRAEAIDLAALVDAFATEGFEIEGTVSGIFPLVLEGGSSFVRDARFLADEQGGVVRYTGSAGGQAANANESVSLAFDALKNFEYTVLELGADGDLNGDVVLKVRMTGRNPEVLSGAPFAFNISIDSRLRELLKAGRDLSSSEWLADIVAEQVAERDEQP